MQLKSLLTVALAVALLSTVCAGGALAQDQANEFDLDLARQFGFNRPLANLWASIAKGDPGGRHAHR